MSNIDKNTCFDLKQLSLFVKNELKEYDLNEISNHLKDCEECSETVENVRSFYFVDAEEVESGFSSSKKELTFISFKYIFKEKISFFTGKLGSVFGSKYGIASGTTISKGSNPVLRFGPAMVLSLVGIFLCTVILFDELPGFGGNNKELVSEVQVPVKEEQKSILTTYYDNKKRDKINKLLRKDKGTLVVGPSDELKMEIVSISGYKDESKQTDNSYTNWKPFGSTYYLLAI